MDQKEIDALIRRSQGSIDEFNKKQEELIKHITEKSEGSSASFKSPAASSVPISTPIKPERKKGKVMGQLSRVTEEAEAGTNMVMGFLENVLTVVSRQQAFIKDISAKYTESPGVINIDEVLNFINDNLTLIEDLIFNAMDAFQFQDIGRQKLMKVMYTLARLNEYLNELLGGEDDRGRIFGRQIEKKTLEQDSNKEEVDDIVADFRKDESVIPQSYLATQEEEIPAPPPAPGGQVVTNDDVDDIIAQFQSKKAKPAATPTPGIPSSRGNQPVSNDDVDSIIAEFQGKNRPG